MKIRENVQLTDLTTMHLRGTARYLIELERADDGGGAGEDRCGGTAGGRPGNGRSGVQ